MNGADSPGVVVITGATSGIGRTTARKFGEDGAHVGLFVTLLARLWFGGGDEENAEGHADESISIE